MDRDTALPPYQGASRLDFELGVFADHLLLAVRAEGEIAGLALTSGRGPRMHRLMSRLGAAGLGVLTSLLRSRDVGFEDVRDAFSRPQTLWGRATAETG